MTIICFPLPKMLLAGVGLVVVITIYNVFQIRFSPTLPCLIVTIICTSTDANPLVYPMARLWDTAIGLGVGMIINSLVFPYDNTNRIRSTAESLDKEIILFLEDMFDGDEHYPNTEKMTKAIDDMKVQLGIFSKQWLLLHLKRNRHKLEAFLVYEKKARHLIAQMEVLCHMEKPGVLNQKNREKLLFCGAKIRQKKDIASNEEADIITNYHVEQILDLRVDLLEVLKR